MQPFLNLQFVEFERERRGDGKSAHDPDGFLRDEYEHTPDPIGRGFMRLVEKVEDIVQSVLDRSDNSTDPAKEGEALDHQTEVPVRSSD